jgi:5-methylcytosine-specific restriction endonuclease McrA
MSGHGLHASVLVLNKSFVPVNLVSVRRAFGLLFNETAEVVLIEDGQMGLYDIDAWMTASQNGDGRPDDGLREWISTVGFQLEVPRIVRLVLYNRYPRMRVSLSRRNVLARDEHYCQYCGRRFPSSELSVDHVLPLSRGGRTLWTNVVCACRRCNRIKGGRTPREAGMALLTEPTEPRFDPQITLGLRQKRYNSWRVFFNEAHLPALAE